MIIYDTSDVEQRAGFISTNLAHELVRLFGIGLRTIRICVKPISCPKRVLQVFFKLIDRADTIQYRVRSKRFELSAQT